MSFMKDNNETFCVCSTSKASLLGAIIFILERMNVLTAPHALIYFGVAMFLVYFRLSSLLLGIHDPFIPFENLTCAILMGGIWDALRRAVTQPKKDVDANAKVDAKTKTDKKND